jgi:hypothetical protein
MHAAEKQNQVARWDATSVAQRTWNSKTRMLQQCTKLQKDYLVQHYVLLLAMYALEPRPTNTAEVAV